MKNRNSKGEQFLLFGKKEKVSFCKFDELDVFYSRFFIIRDV